jgi:hypothetical protein
MKYITYTEMFGKIPSFRPIILTNKMCEFLLKAKKIYKIKSVYHDTPITVDIIKKSNNLSDYTMDKDDEFSKIVSIGSDDNPTNIVDNLLKDL